MFDFGDSDKGQVLLTQQQHQYGRSLQHLCKGGCDKPEEGKAVGGTPGVSWMGRRGSMKMQLSWLVEQSLTVDLGKWRPRQPQLNVSWYLHLHVLLLAPAYLSILWLGDLNSGVRKPCACIYI